MEAEEEFNDYRDPRMYDLYSAGRIKIYGDFMEGLVKEKFKSRRLLNNKQFHKVDGEAFFHEYMPSSKPQMPPGIDLTHSTPYQYWRGWASGA